MKPAGFVTSFGIDPVRVSSVSASQIPFPGAPLAPVECQPDGVRLSIWRVPNTGLCTGAGARTQRVRVVTAETRDYRCGVRDVID